MHLNDTRFLTVNSLTLYHQGFQFMNEKLLIYDLYHIERSIDF